MPDHPPRRLRIAMIGVGGIAGGHIGAIKRLHEQFELVAGFDPQGANAPGAKALAGLPIYTNEQQLYREHPGLDAVAICSPHDAHVPNIHTAMAHGVRGMLVEKPVTTTLEAMDELIELTEREGVKIAVGYVMRHHPDFIRMKQIVDSGEYGAAFAVTCRTEQGMSERWFAQRAWATRDDGLGRGGSLFSHGCHYADLMIWMMGQVVRAAKVSTSIVQGERMQGPDTSMALFEFAGGGIGHLFSSWGIRHCESRRDFRLYLQGAQIVWHDKCDNTVDFDIVLRSGERTPLRSADVGEGVGDDGFANQKPFDVQYRQLYRAVAEGAEPAPGLREARQSMEAILGAVDANSDNRFAVFPDRPVHLPPPRPID